jgi:hypothetical protein
MASYLRADAAALRNHFEQILKYADKMEHLPKANREIDTRLYILSRGSYNDLLAIDRGLVRDLTVKQLDIKHLKHHLDKLDDLISRIVFINEDARIVSYMPQRRIQKSIRGETAQLQLEDVKIKKRGDDKKTGFTSIGPMKAQQATQQDIETLNEAALNTLHNFQVRAALTLTPEVTSIKKRVVTRRTEREKPAAKQNVKSKTGSSRVVSHKKHKEEKTKASETARNLARQAAETRQLKKSGERKAQAFETAKKHVEKTKRAHRERISKQAKKTKN